MHVPKTSSPVIAQIGFPKQEPLQAPSAPRQPGQVPADGFDAPPAAGGWQRFMDDPDAGAVGGSGAVAQVKSPDEQKRDQLLEHMWRDNDPPLSDKEQKQLRAAFRSLSTAQMESLDKEGMRIWRGRDTPPELAKLGMSTGGISERAHYQYASKTLTLNPDLPPHLSDIVHELGHARDDLWNDTKLTKPLSEVKGEKARERQMDAASLMSHTKQKFAVKTYKGGTDSELVDKKMSINDMYKAYVKRTENTPTSMLPASENARSSYAKSSPSEFYAEAFAIFHGDDPQAQARLLTFAPEVFSLLQADAKANGLPTLDEAALAKVDIFDHR